MGRGELHLSILIETLRREGYEFSLSRPEVVLKTIDEQECEPWEEVIIEVPADQVGTITAGLAQRRGELKNIRKIKNGVRLEYQIATSNLIGYRQELLTSTSGEGVLHSSFLEYRPCLSRVIWHRGGAIIAQQTGTATAYTLNKAQQRGQMMVGPGEEIYAGQIVGVNNRTENMVMNLAKGKKLTNMRAASADATVVLTPAWKPSLEQFLTLIGDNEMLEVTPQFLRLRQK